MIYLIAVLLGFIVLLMTIIISKMDMAEHIHLQEVKELQDLNTRMSNYVDDIERYTGA